MSDAILLIAIGAIGVAKRRVKGGIKKKRCSGGYMSWHAQVRRDIYSYENMRNILLHRTITTSPHAVLPVNDNAISAWKSGDGLAGDETTRKKLFPDWQKW